MIGIEPKKPSGPSVPCLSLRAPEAAKALSISERKLSDWTTQGIVPHLKVGGILMYPVDSLRKWLMDAAWKGAMDGESRERHQRQEEDSVPSGG